MKKYIFVTFPITHAGGGQCYVAAKANYLESQGWSVSVFSSAVSRSIKRCVNPMLDKYMDGCIVSLFPPPSYYPVCMINRLLGKMYQIAGPKEEFEEIIVESHDSATALWGELLAEKYGARHYNFLLNEHFRGKGIYYEANMDFFLFKFQRKELLGNLTTFNRLFQGYRTVEKSEYPGELRTDEAPIQDIPSPIVDDIIRKDWNICYIGRGTKPYVENIIIQVGDFASLYPDKSIQLLLVGDAECQRDTINRVKIEHKNLSIVELGFLHPLPLKLYDKVDVVIAGSGSARHSAEIGAITIVADTETKQSDGILGYETLNSIYKSSDSVSTTFTDALKRVLVDKVYLKMENKFPKRKGVEWYVQYCFKLFSQSEQKKEYYSYEKLTGGKTRWMQIISRYVSYFFHNETEWFANLRKGK